MRVSFWAGDLNRASTMDEASSSSSAVASLRLVRLPTSPLKPSVLRQQQQNSVPSGAIGNITSLLATSKPVQVINTF